jgi:PKD repeat protein
MKISCRFLIYFLGVILVFSYGSVFSRNCLLLSFSEDTTVSSTDISDHEIIKTDMASSWNQVFSSMTDLIPKEADIDAFSMIDDNNVWFSLNIDTYINGTLCSDEDLIFWNGTTLSRGWDASTYGVPESADLDALHVFGKAPFEVAFSLNIDATLTIGGSPTLVSDEDMIYFIDGTGLDSILFDGSTAGIPAASDLDSFSVENSSTWIISINTGGTISTLFFEKPDLLEWDNSAGSFNSALFFDASEKSIQSNVNLNAASVSKEIPTPTPTSTPTPAAPTAEFTASPTSGWAPLTVCFSDLSSDNGDPITSWEWDFNNDSIVDSTTKDVCYVFSDPGKYSVGFTVSNSIGSNKTVKNDYITANYSYPFASPLTEGWEPWAVSAGTLINDPLGSFYVAPTLTQASVIGIDSTTYSNSFGYWDLQPSSSMKNCDADYIYRAEYRIKTDQADSAKSPQVRMRTGDRDSLSMTSFVVDRGNNAPGITYSNFNSYYFKSLGDAVTGSELVISFDLVDMTSTQSGNLFCDSIEVTRFPPPVTGTMIWSCDTVAEFQNWTSFSAPGLTDVTTVGTDPAGGLWLETPGPKGSNSIYFGGWSSPSGASAPSFQAGFLYEVIFFLHSESAAAQQNLPMIRLRAGNWDFNWTAMRSIRQGGGVYEHLPPSGGNAYSVYIEAPPYLTGNSADPSDSIVLNIDLVDGEATEYGRVYLDRVEIWKLALP